MDEIALNELLECSVCLDRLDDNNKVLPCQHTFCQRCLEEIVSTKLELRCPECRTVVRTKIDDLPHNILLVRLLESMRTAANAASRQAVTGETEDGAASTALATYKVCSKNISKLSNGKRITIKFSVSRVLLPHRLVQKLYIATTLVSLGG